MRSKFILKVRPHRYGKNPKVHEPQTVKVIATGKFEAELRYKDHHPKITVLSCKRGARVETGGLIAGVPRSRQSAQAHTQPKHDLLLQSALQRVEHTSQVDALPLLALLGLAALAVEFVHDLLLRQALRL